MGSSPYSFFRLKKTIFFRFFMILLLTSISHHRMNLCSNLPPAPADPSTLSNLGGSSSSYDVISSLKTIHLKGHLNFDNVNHAAKDFGNRHHYLPLAIVHPKSVSDISSTIKHVFEMGILGIGISGGETVEEEDQQHQVTIAARGRGHSLQGQAQAHGGVVIDMGSLDDQEGRPKTIIVHTSGGGGGVNGKMTPYADVCGGEVWINILHESLKYGLAPKSWTDYLHLTVGGTLSNAGISGQAFRHGPQINNVYQLEVVTGKGDIVTCSENQDADLFYGVLGGLGQFGIITRARISLEPAPKMVKWIRVLYSEFSIFSKDQEHLISSRNTFDYIEGFVLINRTGLLNNWRSSFNPQEPLQATQFNSDGRTLYCLEMAKYFDPVDDDDDDDDDDNNNNHIVNQVIESLLSELSYIPSTLFLSEVSYVDFLDRVHVSEIKLREKGLWEVPHPWLNLLIPKSRIHEFAKQVFGNILTNTANGPILIYPANQSKWNNRTSLVTPEEDIFYLVAFLSTVPPSSTGTDDDLERVLTQNQRILDFCKEAGLGMKQYLPHYTTQDEWQAHFGHKWELLLKRKSMYDPLAILSPGHRIFQKPTSFPFRRILT